MVPSPVETLRAMLQPQPGLTVVFELELTGGDGAVVQQLRITEAGAEVAEGGTWIPDVIVTTHVDDWAAVAEGFLSPSAALIDGRIAIAGDVGLLARVAPSLFG